ncbi:MAG: PEGA domain-containing protein [Patescibacteria group bacterium]|nr:PEGA domain-containing protein [Patescibacteria group bacterium]
MTKKSRYLILAACIVFFILAAPAVLLYVRGIAYDPATGGFYNTGILAVKCDPKDIMIKLDGKLYQTGAGTLRFLKPKEYEVSLEKPGYLTWSKRLSVDEGRVTWANPAGQNIILFFDQAKQQMLSEAATAFLETDGEIFYTTPQELVTTSLSAPDQTASYPLPAPAADLSMVPGGQILAVKTQATSTPWLLFDSSQNIFLPASQALDASDKLKYQDNSTLYVIKPAGLFAVNLKTGKSAPVLAGAKDLLYEGGYYYYLVGTSSGLSLYSTPALDQPGTLLTAGLPMADATRIIINAQKQAYILLDHSLYLIASQPTLVAEGIKSLRLNPDKDTLALVNDSEFLRLNSGSSRPDLVSRSLFPITNGIILPNYGNGFLVKDKQILAEELDARDHQNEFVLYSGLKTPSFTISDDARKMVVLDGNQLKILTIR